MSTELRGNNNANNIRFALWTQSQSLTFICQPFKIPCWVLCRIRRDFLLLFINPHLLIMQENRLFLLIEHIKYQLQFIKKSNNTIPVKVKVCRRDVPLFGTSRFYTVFLLPSEYLLCLQINRAVRVGIRITFLMCWQWLSELHF